MKVLFIGGTGIISSACSNLAVKSGVELYLLNRGQSFRLPPEGAQLLKADIRDPKTVTEAIKETKFDVVVDWVAYTPEQVKIDLDLFRRKTGQYIFISSASAYQKPPAIVPITESTPLDNPYWQYSRNKIDCENVLMEAYRTQNYPVTIVRPSHTYDRSTIPIQGRWTTIDRMIRGKEVIIHGDGTSLWTLTNNADFAIGFNGLFGNTLALGEAYHITSDEWLTWNQIYESIATAAGVNPKVVHVPSDVINSYDQDWGAGLLGDKAHCGIFDNTKVKSIVPEFQATTSFSHGAEAIIAWHRANPFYQVIDDRFNDLCDRIITAQKRANPS
jgi:nucleoside-diphosphate-sugar epimerase